jgi:glucose/arabinose dehydrogenase
MKLVCFALTIVLVLPSRGLAAALPAGFVETQVTGGLTNPTAMQFAPDGRLFICEQGGRLRVVKDGALLSTPFLTIPPTSIDSTGERGLLGIAFDPQFAANQFVYVYYTATMPTLHNRVSRFTASGDMAMAGSEMAILDLDNLSATNHNGGAINFGPDGKLYIAVGENAVPSNAQWGGNLLGKMLRINKDGTIPTDNPYYAGNVGRNRAIWALGLRNPFTFAFDPAGGQMFINDVGQGTWEEVNDGRIAANYGWPDTEGPTTDVRFTSPRYAYMHSEGCAITGGTFYSPLAPQFPAEYSRDYFFAEFCGGWIRRLDVASNTVTMFASGISLPVDLKVSDDGALYYLARGAGAVYRVTYAAAPPVITTQPVSRTVQPGAPATFSVRASGTPPLQYQWRRNGLDINGATAPDYTVAAAAATDNGARYRAVVVNRFGNALSNEAVLTVSTGGGGGGTGLAATYFDTSTLTGASISRVDPTIDFAWGTGSPAAGIAVDTFSARWTGQIMPQFSQTYTFYTVSDDGVRLWVNGQRIVNNWTNHAATENRGTIALVGGQRYAIAMEYYENAGSATARLLWSSASTPKAVVPSSRLFPGPAASPSTIRVNFQLNAAPVPAGYLKDGGHAYGDRGNGRTYGWNIDNTAQMRDRNSGLSPDQRYDTLAYMQRPANPDAVWEIAVPNGTYQVHAVAGDPSYFNITYRIAIEGVVVVNGTSNSATRWIDGTSTVTVTDGRLTLRSAAGATANKICFVEITPQ